MAKCPICNSSKGKRKCLIIDGMICSFCCGSTRTEEACTKCMFYQKPKRKYHFQDQQMDQENQIIVDGVHYVEESISEDFEDVANEEIVKILGVIRFVARRRTNIGREYMTLIHQYVGQRIGSGIRILSN